MPNRKLSTGAWIFATAALVLAVAAPVSYAAATSTVAIGNTANSNTALVDPARQLVTVEGAPPSQVVHVSTGGQGCVQVYTPPSGKAIVVTAVTWQLGSGTAGVHDEADLTDYPCNVVYDDAFTVQAYDVQRQTYPTGLPMPAVGLYAPNNGGNYAGISVTGYLIPASQLPPATQMRTMRNRLFGR
jgi:hypothetical protein